MYGVRFAEAEHPRLSQVKNKDQEVKDSLVHLRGAFSTIGTTAERTQ